MLCPVQRRLSIIWVAVLGVGAALPCACLADESPLQAQLAAGEFSTALDAAGQLPGDLRDAAFREIAAAQAQVGASQAAVATIASIRDDQLRTATLGQLFGGIGTTALDTGNYPGMPGNNQGTGGLGGGPQPDFQTLIALVTETIRKNDWEQNGGLIGFIKPHPGGVYVDASGQMKLVENAQETTRLASLRRTAAQAAAPGGAHQASAMRKISLTRLEREAQARRALNQPLDAEMLTLAGIQRITHLFVYPESGDIVLAGPAGDWYLGRENRYLSVDNDRPVVLLDDLVTLLRREFSQAGPFGCSIEPTQAGLQQVQAFVDGWQGKPIGLSDRVNWTKELRNRLGMQDVKVFGVDPTSRLARTLVEADYRMKLVGIGLEEGTLNVPSYFEIVRAAKAEPPAMGLLRWWFTVNHDAVLTSPNRDVYEFSGQGVKLLSENEFLSDQGERVATGAADDMNRRFAENFTKHFAVLAQKHPIYADLQNVFDLALVCAVMKGEGVCDRAGWHQLGFRDPRVVPVERSNASTQVESAANSAELSKTRIMAVISGGVWIDDSELAKAETIKLDDRGRLAKERQSSAPANLPVHGWWWD